jgi:hypothetical protein
MRSERGQAVVLAVMMMTSFLGMAALVLDTGSWFRERRHLQATADAAALAGAQALPDDPGSASSLALQYAGSNGGNVSASDITFSTAYIANDTITVHAHSNAPGFFSKVFGISTVSVGATAAARAAIPGQARYAAPFAVDRRHPELSGPGCPCYGVPTSLDLQKIGPGAFRIINIDGSQGGTGQTTLADWILNGFSGLMSLGWYWSDSGAKFNASEIKNALNERLGKELLFPIYSQTQGQGSNFDYKIVGWAGYRLTGYDTSGNKSLLYGSFTRTIWSGIQGQSSGPDYGVRVVALVQ